MGYEYEDIDEKTVLEDPGFFDPCSSGMCGPECPCFCNDCIE